MPARRKHGDGVLVAANERAEFAAASRSNELRLLGWVPYRLDYSHSQTRCTLTSQHLGHHTLPAARTTGYETLCDRACKMADSLTTDVHRTGVGVVGVVRFVADLDAVPDDNSGHVVGVEAHTANGGDERKTDTHHPYGCGRPLGGIRPWTSKAPDHWGSVVRGFELLGYRRLSVQVLHGQVAGSYGWDSRQSWQVAHLHAL